MKKIQKISQFIFILLLIPISGFGWTILRPTAPNESLELSGWDMNSRNGELSFELNAADCDISEAELNADFDAAIAVWNKVKFSGITLRRGSSTTGTAAADPPTVICDNAQAIITTDGTAGVGAPGSINTTTGEILTGRLVLNSNAAHSSRMSNLTATTRTIVIAHEIGHVLGIGHSSDTSSLMYFNASAKTELNFSQDDIDAISYLYPRNEIGGDGVFGCGSIKNTGSGGSGPSLPLMVNFGLLVIFFLLSYRFRSVLSKIRSAD